MKVSALTLIVLRCADLMLLIIMAAQLVGCQSQGPPCSSITAFETRPSGTAWGSFEADAAAGKCGASAKAVAEYYEAVQAQILPNSMTLVGMTPDEKVAREKQRASVALSVIRADSSNGLWRLLNAMAMHPDDEVVVLTGLEIAARLSNAQFDGITSLVAHEHPDMQRVVALARARAAQP